MGVLTADGHVAIRGRRKEMYVRGGYNVYPAEVENVLSTHPSVALCAVIGYPDATFGEKGCAFIVPAAGQTVDTDELARLCREQLAEYKVPDRLEVVDSLPMTPAGKIRKAELKAGTD
jgi:fatty-acyl-CoA synthase